MIKLSSLVNELIIKDLSTNKNYNLYFMLYKDKLFIFDDKSKIKNAVDFIKNHPVFLRDPEYLRINLNDIYNFLNVLSETGPDVLVGEWYPDRSELVIWIKSEIAPSTSLQVKKVVDTLKVKKVIHRYIDFVKKDSDEAEKSIPAKKITGQIPKKMYHGTSSDQLESILKYGLDPGRGPSRFSRVNITHSDKVFLSGNFENSIFYADNAVSNSDNKYGNYPIILEIEIPDTNLLIPDYDMYATSSEKMSRHTKQYYNVSPSFQRSYHSLKPMTASREVGKWGYVGRIPAKFITAVWYYNTYEKKWHRTKPNTWLKLLNRYDFDTISHRLGMDNYDISS